MIPQYRYSFRYHLCAKLKPDTRQSSSSNLITTCSIKCFVIYFLYSLITWKISSTGVAWTVWSCVRNRVFNKTSMVAVSASVQTVKLRDVNSNTRMIVCLFSQLKTSFMRVNLTRDTIDKKKKKMISSNSKTSKTPTLIIHMHATYSINTVNSNWARKLTLKFTTGVLLWVKLLNSTSTQIKKLGTFVLKRDYLQCNRLMFVLHFEGFLMKTNNSCTCSRAAENVYRFSFSCRTILKVLIHLVRPPNVICFVMDASSLASLEAGLAIASV